MKPVFASRTAMFSAAVFVGSCGSNPSGTTTANDPQTGRHSSAALDSMGGSLTASSGLTLTIPAGALQTPSNVSVRVLQDDALPPQTHATLQAADLTPAVTFELDTGGVQLREPATLAIPNDKDIATGLALVLQVAPDIPGASAVLVEVATVSPSLIETASEPFPGIRSPGTFVVAAPTPDVGASPRLFAHGIVHDAASLPVANGLVQSMGSPIPSLTATDGSYVVDTGVRVSDLPSPASIFAQDAAGFALGATTPTIDRAPPANSPIVEVETIVVVVQEIRIEQVHRSCIECDEELKKQVQKAVDTLKDIKIQTDPLFGSVIVEACGEPKTFDSMPIETAPVVVVAGAELGDLTACGEVALKLAKVEFRPLDFVVGSVAVEDSAVATVSSSVKRIDNDHIQAQLTVTPSQQGQTSAALEFAVLSLGYKQYVQVPGLQLPIFCPGSGTIEHVVKPSNKLKLVDDKDIPVVVRPASSDADRNRVVFSNPTPTGTINDCLPSISVDVETPCNTDGLGEGSIEFFQLDDESVEFALTTLSQGSGLRISHQPAEDLETGTHTVTVSAGAIGGDHRELFSWSFDIDSCQSLWSVTVTIEDTETDTTFNTVGFCWPADEDSLPSGSWTFELSRNGSTAKSSHELTRIIHTPRRLAFSGVFC